MIAALSERGRASLLAFIAEREGIRLRRASGAPPPWTDDPILREWSFCNVRREDDRGTRWIAQHWRDPHADDPDVWFPMAAARLTNWPPTLLEIRYPVPWNREHFVTTLQERAARGDKVWGDAYTIPAGEKGVSKYDHIAGVLDKLWTARERLRPKPGERLVDFHNRLRDRKGLGDFLAAQVVADVKYVEPLKSASDWMAFAASGPGSRRGLNRVMGRDKDAAWEEYNWRARLKELREAIAPELERTGLGDLHAQDLQNCLCEFDKYERVRLNEGKPKRRFVPHGTEAAEKPAKRVKTKPAAPLAADPDNAASAPPRSAREASRAAEPVEIVIEPDAQPVETVVAIGSGATVLKAAAPIVRQENRTPPPRPPVEITVLTKSDGILSKRISLRADGKVNSDGSECRMARGTAQRVQVAEAAGLAALISGMQSNQALALGALRSGLPETVTVITKDALEKVNGAPRPDVIARTGSNISFRAGKQAWALVDFDTKGMPADVADVMERHGGFMPALATVMPELAGAACVIRSSTSSGLSRADTGEVCRGRRGCTSMSR